MKHRTDILEECMKEYEITSKRAFATEISLPHSTIQNWSKSKISKVGNELLAALIRNKKLEKELDAFKDLKKILMK